LAVPADIVQIGDKCYVGGKAWTNTDGSIIDFLYASRATANVTLVEIKTPATRLIGSEYRSAVFAPSSALAGSVVQAWSYRDNLLKNYYALAYKGGEVSVEAFCPQCLVIIGNSQVEFLHTAKKRSFDLFRNSLAQTVIVTFDELFSKVASIVDLLNDDYDLQS
jgi:hypothetical protein